MDKYIEVTDGHHITAKQKNQVWIKMCNNNGDPLIATLHKLLLTPYLRNRLFSIVTLINSGHTCLFHKGFWSVYFGAKEKNVVTLPHSAERKHEFLGEIKEMSMTKKFPARKKIALELLHQILSHRSTRSLLAGDTGNVWEDIDLRIDTYPYCISCQIYSMNKNDRSKIPLQPKSPFK